MLAAVDELGYVPNGAARALVTRQTEAVALVVSESDERFFAEPFFASIVRGVSSELADDAVPAAAVHRAERAGPHAGSRAT